MRGSGSIFDYANLHCYKRHKRGGSYIDSVVWIKKKKSNNKHKK